MGEIRSARLLGAAGELAFERDENSIAFTLPERLPFEEGFVIRLDKA